jgi:hypothetical protein
VGPHRVKHNIAPPALILHIEVTKRGFGNPFALPDFLIEGALHIIAHAIKKELRRCEYRPAYGPLPQPYYRRGGV